MRFAALLVALAACDGAGSSGVDANPDDLDGDGIANAADNCAQLANPDQHDEDADALGDRCDNCPARANPDQRDTTEIAKQALADGIGDACDPRSGFSGDERAAFYTFADPAQASAWTGDGWSIADDAATSGATARWTSARTVTGDGLVLVAQVSALAFTQASGELALAFDGDGIATGGVCTLRRTNAGDEIVIAEPGGATMTQLLPSPVEPPLTLIARRAITPSNASIACAVQQGGATQDVSVALVDNLAIGIYGVATTNAVATLSAFEVYTSPGPKDP